MKDIKFDKFKKLILSGDFTIISWDNGQFSVYKGHQNVDSVNQKNLKPVVEYDYNEDGYMPKIVHDIVSALGGKTDSI